MAKDGEASVEEILESIKKVIARDNRGDALQTRQKPDTLAPDEARVGDQDKPVDSESSGAEDTDEILELADVFAQDDFETESAEAADGLEAPLITEHVRGAMQENLAALAMISEPGAKPQIVRSGETSLEGLTRELLRPMLAQWLDENLPAMVEKLVQAEIARIAGKRR
ncbi:MAG: DUF2497 domain-containing protein [Pseudomonadota bacterium]